MKPTGVAGKLRAILAIPYSRRMAVALGGIYLVLFLVALQDISLGGRGFEVMTTEWLRLFDRTGAITFDLRRTDTTLLST